MPRRIHLIPAAPRGSTAERWLPRAVGLVVTALWVGAIGVTAARRPPERQRVASSSPTPTPERLTYIVEPSGRAGAGPAIAPPPPQRTSPTPSIVYRDTTARAGGAAQPTTEPAGSTGASTPLIAPTVTPSGIPPVTSAPAAPARSCTLGPCADQVTAGARTTFPPLTAHERDSIYKAVGAAVAKAPKLPGTERTVAQEPPAVAHGAPVPVGGVSIPVGLPLGGPSAAQRKRDAALNAENLERLAHIRARADSLVAARRDSLMRDSLAAVGERKP